jgi:dihydropteridine reductase
MLNPQGFLMLTGSAAVFEGPVNYAYAYAMSKAATHALALSLAKRTEIPESADVCTILPQIIDTPANRQAMPDADTSEWAPPDKIAQMVRHWAEGENRPINGSFAKIEYKN